MNDVFSIKPFSFPSDFLFGSAVAGHQVEGDNIHSSHYARELEKLAKDPNTVLSGKACNHYEMYGEDIEILKKYSWPGNVRELQNIMERSLILSKGDTLEFQRILPEIYEKWG